MFVDGERLSSDGGLIDLEEGVFGHDATIGGDDGTLEHVSITGINRINGSSYLFNLKDITRNDHGSFDFLKTTTSENDGFESEGFLQLLDNRTGLEFLDKPNRGVEKQQSADNTEVDPIFETRGKDSSGLREKTC